MKKFCEIGDWFEIKRDDETVFYKCVRYHKSSYMYYTFNIISSIFWSFPNLLLPKVKFRRYKLEELEKKQIIKKIDESVAKAKLSLLQ